MLGRRRTSIHFPLRAREATVRPNLARKYQISFQLQPIPFQKKQPHTLTPFLLLFEDRSEMLREERATALGCGRCACNLRVTATTSTRLKGELTLHSRPTLRIVILLRVTWGVWSQIIFGEQ